MELSFIKCPDCGTKNTQNQRCTNCGAILDTTIRRKQEEERKKQQRKLDNPVPTQTWIVKALGRLERHPNSIVRFMYSVLNGIWLFIAMIVGGLIAAVIAIAAG